MGHVAPSDPRLETLPVSEIESQLRQRLTSNLDQMPNLQCVSLAKLAVDDFRTVWTWRRGASVLSERLPPGTPIATFMNRDGVDSELYDAGEGVGAPGNMTTHAAVLVDYIENEDGVIDGILVFDQHALLTEFRRMIYPVDPTAFGTATASNYYTILDDAGLPLGGTNSPLWETYENAA